MLVSHRHKFAFIHVPKTAGASIHSALWIHSDMVDDYWANRCLARMGIRVNHHAPWPLKKFRTHTPAAILQRELPADAFESLFKFAFVRNPWDLLVSSYHYMLAHPSHHRRGLTRRLRSFEAYVDYEIRRGKMSQASMLTNRDGKLLVDFVGRFESLRSDFAYACRRIGLEAALPRANTTHHHDYRNYYDDRLADAVGRFFAEDVERFGYDFAGGGLETARPGLRRAA